MRRSSWIRISSERPSISSHLPLPLASSTCVPHVLLSLRSHGTAFDAVQHPCKSHHSSTGRGVVPRLRVNLVSSGHTCHTASMQHAAFVLQAYYILDEVLIAGELQESSKKSVARVIATQVSPRCFSICGLGGRPPKDAACQLQRHCRLAGVMLQCSCSAVAVWLPCHCMVSFTALT